MQTIELFAGTKSFSKVAKKRGYNTITVDNNVSLIPDICGDILKVSKNLFPKKIRILWASPPCTTFSVAGRNTNYIGFMPNSVNASLGLAYVQKTLELIEELKPDYWFIENPVGYLRKFPFMMRLNKVTVWYCKYGDNRAKPTDIWTNLSGFIPKKCFNENPNCNHDRAPRGSKTGTQGFDNAKDRSRIPEKLFNEIFDVIENKVKEYQGVL